MALPMPTMTASTSTLMPADTTLPSTRSARNAVRFHSANGTRMKPASVVSLNSIRVTKSCTARMKKLTITTSQARNSTTMVARLRNTSGKPVELADLRAGSDAPRRRRCWRAAPAAGSRVGLTCEPLASSPEPGERAKEDARQRVEVGDDEGEGTDVERLLDRACAMTSSWPPIAQYKPGQRDVDHDQRRGEERHLAAAAGQSPNRCRSRRHRGSDR